MSRKKRTTRGGVRRERRYSIERLEERCLLAGTGLTGQYFDNADFSTLKLTRTDAAIDLNWGTGAPAAGVGADTFSVRWTGQVQAQHSELHTFHINADNGARLWVNRKLILDNWSNASAVTQLSGSIDLSAGQFYDIQLDYYDNTGAASVKLEWSSSSLARQVVPTAQLYPLATSDDRGSIQHEIWSGISGSDIASLTSLADYPSKPSGREYLTSFESLRSDWADNFGQRVRGYLVPAVSGSYVLAISGDEQTQLLLSSDASPANAALIASSSAATAFREFTKFASQQSAPVALVAGQKYYIEALHKEGTGADHFSVGWKVPGSSQFTVIGGEVLAPYGTDLATPAQGSFLNTLAQQHPRLMATPQRFDWVKQQIASAGQMQTWYNTIKSQADGYLTAALPAYSPDNRGTILGISRSVVDHVGKLALVWRMTGDNRYAERAWEELNAAANFPDWHPAHFLDTAEMTHAFAIGYDWLYDYWTAARRTVLSDAIVNKGLNQAMSLYPSSSWTSSTSNNWNLVCNGGMILGALAIAEVQPTVAESILSKAIPSVRAVMKHFSSDAGAWYEGPGYWDYSTSYNSRMLAALETALGSDFGLGQTPGLSETGDFAVSMTSPAGLSFNFADGGAGVMKGPQLFWYARRFNRPMLAWYERSNGSASPLDLLWYDSRGSDPGSLVMPTDAHWRGDQTNYRTQDVVTMRSNWSDPNATFVGFKAGKVGDSHGHLDAGSFVLDALGQRWAYDLGGDDYALQGYFGSSRWTYYRLRAEGQNTLVINPGSGAEQVTGAVTPIIRQQSTADGSISIADLTSAYSGMSRVWRGMSLSRHDGSVLVQDEIQASSAADVWWFMHVKLSASQVQISADGTSALLTSGSSRLWIKILPGSNGQFALMDPAPLPTSPNPAGQNANAGYKKLAIHLQSVLNRTLAVWMVPLAAGENPPAVLPAIVPLANWTAPADDRHWIGDTDGYVAGGAADSPPVDPGWLSQIGSATGLSAAGLDSITDNRAIPFTFNFTVPPGQQVIGARLDLGLRSTNGDSSADRLYLDSTANSFPYSSLGWTSPTTTPSSRTLDLSNQLALLQDGKLNVAITKNTAIDWAVLNLEYAPTGVYRWTTLGAAADAYVRDGSYATQNFGSGDMTVKQETANSGFNREAYLRFDLSTLPANVTSALVRFVPINTAAAPENTVSFVSDDSWLESGINWNNRPTSGSELSAWTVVANAGVWLDVTALVQAERAGDGKLSLKIASTIPGADYWTTYASRENANAALRPQLLVTTLAADASTILRIDGDQDAPNQDDSIRIVSDSNYLDVYLNNTSSVPTFRRDLATLQQVIVNGLGGNDTIWVDGSGGNPVPRGGFVIDGGVGNDTLGIAGATALVTAGQVNLGASSVAFSNSEYSAFSVGSVTISGTTVRLGAGNAIDALTDLTIADGGVLDLNGRSTLADAVTLADGTITGGTLSGSVYTVQSGTISANLGGAGTLTKRTTGKVVISGNNTYTGATSVYEGILNIRGGSALGAGTAAVTISADGATNRYGALELEGPDFTIDKPLFTTGNGFGGVSTNGTPFSGNGCVRNISGNHTFTGAVTMTGGGGASNYQSDAGTLTFTGTITPNTTGRVLNLQGAGNGVISGAIANGSTVALPVNKSGTGTWTLSGANSYTGSTTVSAGTLQVDGSIATGATTVSSSATLRGAGTFTGAATNSGTLSPGTPGTVGTLTFNDLSLSSSAVLNFDLGAIASSDQVRVNQKLSVAALKLNAANLGGLTQGTYTLIDYATAGSIGTLTLGAMPAGFTYQLVNNTVNTSIDLVVTNIQTIVVTASRFVHDRLPQQLTVTFSRNVGSSLAPNDLSVQMLPSGTVFNPASVAWNASSSTATFTFASALADGNYRATLPVGAVSDATGATTPTTTFDFFVLAGDANRDRGVDFNDLTALAANYGGANKVWADGDFNGDGTVNFLDLTTLAANYSAVLPAPAPQMDAEVSSVFAADAVPAFATLEAEGASTEMTTEAISNSASIPPGLVFARRKPAKRTLLNRDARGVEASVLVRPSKQEPLTRVRKRDVEDRPVFAVCPRIDLFEEDVPTSHR